MRRDVLGRVGDKWSSLVLLLLEAGPRRYSDLSRSSSISQRMLTLTLRELHRDGLVARHQGCYALTTAGQSLCALVTALVDWADDQHEHIAGSRVRYDADQSASSAAASSSGWVSSDS
jgi:DNA-binding HxlR family transcriptional regulator